MPMPAIQSVGPAALGPEFTIQGIEGTAPAQTEQSGGGFTGALMDQIGKLEELQQGASVQAQLLATGQADDVSTVVMEIERASLAMQLAVQVRNKAVEAYQDIYRMQV
ncbi:MAG: flagellar hook-basal body complex protein FliE [Thermoleophilia bacterium]